MTESFRAIRTPAQIGSLTVDGFMLPDGSYRMSLTQTAGSVGKPARNTFDFLRIIFLHSNRSKALLGETYTDYTPERRSPVSWRSQFKTNKSEETAT
ncbi:hypothetical protein [Microcoleus sp. B4-D4]|uniref:hypothetical protein n=1 Tax=Microcoleus sp. B4-D4 TaxID=2818667 RepID=UPI002FD5889B